MGCGGVHGLLGGVLRFGMYMVGMTLLMTGDSGRMTSQIILKN